MDHSLCHPHSPLAPTLLQAAHPQDGLAMKPALQEPYHLLVGAPESLVEDVQRIQSRDRATRVQGLKSLKSSKLLLLST